MRTVLAPYKHYSRPGGFSLVEMAIVLLIVALLLGGLLPTLSSQIEQQRRGEARKQMDEIVQTLLGYAASQQPPRLPCPANPAIATGSANAGIADCTITSGVVPWVTLGTSETDAWGRRFSYSVSSTFTTSFTLTSTGTINIKNKTGGSNIAEDVPAAIISHGPNGRGAYTPAGTQIATSSDTDEDNNSNGAPFVSHDLTPTFDDLVIWLSPHTLFNRMVAAGKLP
ncbi:MAG: prepilin-type N-terminal cleavage/methylation domain-containing protein [Gallionellales bacterium RBG_16_56_9]|nr:MAG: prepilin-type N-terminal cleavage/methylation domain-containing protein [Gallionellales bacterium RBG_16_56_9]